MLTGSPLYCTLAAPLVSTGWVTVSGFNSQCRTFISVCNQPSRSTQPGHPFVGGRNEYSDASWLGSKGRYRQVKLCDPVVTHGPYLSALEIKGLYMKRCINSSVSFLLPLLLFV